MKNLGGGIVNCMLSSIVLWNTIYISMKQSYKILVLLAVICSVFTAGSNSGTVTYGPKPTINSTSFYSLNTSPVNNNQFELSNSLINLVMTQFLSGGVIQTNITVSSYKRSAPTR